MDLEFLISRKSTGTHTFVTSKREFTHALDDVLVMFRLLIFAYKSATGLVLIDEEEKKVQLLNPTLRISNISTNTSWIRYFHGGEGRGKGVTLEAFLSY